MYKNRLILTLGVLSVLLVTMAVSRPFSKAPASVDLSWPPRPDYSHLNEKPRLAVADDQSADDFFQRHTDWTNSVANIIPVTGNTELSDYFLRHPELSISAAPGIDMNSDFYQRHPAWTSNVENIVPVTGNTELSDYFQRHTELSAPAGITIDTADYFLRHPELRPAAPSTDLSDYFLRH